jgi:hypothetical protein
MSGGDRFQVRALPFAAPVTISTFFCIEMARIRMNEHAYRARLLLSWASRRRRLAVDKKGLAVALIFLVALAFWAGERGGKSTELYSTWQEQPDLSAHVEIRPAAKSFLEVEIPRPDLVTGLSRELDDPRRGQRQ